MSWARWFCVGSRYASSASWVVGQLALRVHDARVPGAMDAVGGTSRGCPSEPNGEWRSSAPREEGVIQNGGGSHIAGVGGSNPRLLPRRLPR